MWPWIAANWEFIFGVAGVIGVILTIVIYFLQRQPKQLDYEIRSDFELINPNAQQVQENLKLTYSDEPIKEPWVVIVRVRNTGKKSITQDDFATGTPIKLGYESGVPVDVRIIGASPDIPPTSLIAGFAEVINTPAEEQQSVSVTPKLLKAGEWIDIQLLFNSDHGKMTVATRFADQRRPMRRVDTESPERRRNTRIVAIATMATAFVLLLLAILAAPGPMLDPHADVSSLINESPAAFIFSLLTMIILLFGLVFYIFRTAPKRD
jgi:Ni,Fe-hydrogenase III small subunit